MVVEQDGLAIAGQSDITLDARAGVNRRGEGGKAVLGNAGTVQAAMSEARPPRI